MSVSVVGYGLGNLGSVVNMFKRIGTEVRIIDDPDEVAASDRVLLPGIGAFDHGMEKLHTPGWDTALRDFAATGKPLMGICLGMQLLLDSSEEGVLPGLGLIPGESRKFVSAPGLRIPHMGWNSIVAQHPDDLIAGAETGSRFYFVHSYAVAPKRAEDTLAISHYGQDFASMIRSGNVMGAQFHPEKSHTFGMTVLRNFAGL
jgi:glutamine amidotransferase